MPLRLLLSLVLGLLPLAAPAKEATAMPVNVLLETNLGAITLELYPDKAPKTVANFTDYVRAGHYNGTVFHRVIPNFMAQGGGFTADLQQKPTNAPITNEADNGLQNLRGTIAMARTGEPHSASAQFFINVADNAFLNFTAPTRQGWGYAVFGKVTAGMDVVDAMVALPTGAAGPFGSDVPKQAVVIESARVLDAAE
ncbi:peptidylprolyl isomerase [Immundisolibacter sp.]|uniref:peptidylprolyl isomerase n=2 Tax=Immundisolibacter sp. TaxID=1934948 RepID=UPI0019CE93BA|nr:peptidyl-prolyl cis-trans isomerase [Immundisolibacter sp.]MEA3220256.1 Peptidyl-prolyl cis-trans isomerase cyp18 [Immundisolibacter sp.]